MALNQLQNFYAQQSFLGFLRVITVNLRMMIRTIEVYHFYDLPLLLQLVLSILYANKVSEDSDLSDLDIIGSDLIPPRLILLFIIKLDVSILNKLVIIIIPQDIDYFGRTRRPTNESIGNISKFLIESSGKSRIAHKNLVVIYIWFNTITRNFYVGSL